MTDNIAKQDLTMHSHSEGEIDFKEIFTVLWRKKFLITFIVACLTAVGVAYSLSLSNKYYANALLAPVEGQTNSLGALAGQFGGLASLAGINLPSGGGDNVSLATEVLRSRVFIEGFIRDNDLLDDIVAADGWDESSDTLTFDPDIYDTSTNTWVRSPIGLRGPVPTYSEAHEVFIQDYLRFSVDQDTGFVTIGVLSFSPSTSRDWTNKLIKRLNETMRERAQQEAIKSIEFLNNKIEETKVSTVKATLFELIEEQTKTLMFAEVREEYMFRVIDPAVLPELKNSPKRVIIVLGFMFFALGVAVFGVLIHYYYQKDSI